jgi:hypothetical protein
MGKDLDESLKSSDKAADKDTAKEAANTPDNAGATPPAEPFPIAQAATDLGDKEVAGAGVGPVAPEAGAESTSSSGAGKPQ